MLERVAFFFFNIFGDKLLKNKFLAYLHKVALREIAFLLVMPEYISQSEFQLLRTLH